MSDRTSRLTLPANQNARKGNGATWAALLLGVPLGVGLLAFLQSAHFTGTLVQRYVSHPIECVEVVVFCCALIALLTKLLGVWSQRRAFRTTLLPEWDGQPRPVSEAVELLAEVSRQPRRLRDSWLGRRTLAVLDFVCRRRSAGDLDDHLRTLADNDAMALDGSYRLVGYMNWLLPILGFLGTVLGITDAVAGVTPEKLEASISEVTGGLALAFDTTGLALILVIPTMFLTFVVQKREEAVLDAVDHFIDQHLAHRFERPDGASAPFLAAVQESAGVLLRATEQLVQRQAFLWAETLRETEERRLAAEREQQERLTAALEEALQRTLTGHQQSLSELREETDARTTEVLQPLAALASSLHEQRSALVPVTEGIRALATTLVQLQEDEGQLLRLQHLLRQNLTTLAAAGSFEQAVHSLTAAVHLLTARATPAPWRLVSDEGTQSAA